MPSFLKDVSKPWYVRAALAVWFAFTGWDVLSGQLDLPNIRQIVGMSGSLLPWWGWLILLLAILVGALFDYVRRNIPVQNIKTSGGNDLAKIHVDMETKKQVTKLADKIENIENMAESLLEDSKTQDAAIENYKWSLLAIYHRERMIALSNEIDELGFDIGLRDETGKVFTEVEFEKWDAKFSVWRTILGQWCRYASFYLGRDPQNEIEKIDEKGLNENWGVKPNQFPEEGITKYKTFRIYFRNWSYYRDDIHRKVKAQAFEGQQHHKRQHYGI